MASNPKHPPGPPMTLGNMRELGVHHLIAYDQAAVRLMPRWRVDVATSKS
jgi:hypothetical protein